MEVMLTDSNLRVHLGGLHSYGAPDIRHLTHLLDPLVGRLTMRAD